MSLSFHIGASVNFSMSIRRSVFKIVYSTGYRKCFGEIDDVLVVDDTKIIDENDERRFERVFNLLIELGHRPKRVETLKTSSENQYQQVHVLFRAEGTTIYYILRTY